MAQVTETLHTDWNVCWKELGSIHGQAGKFRVRIPGAHVFEINFSGRQEGSTVSSIICDH